MGIETSPPNSQLCKKAKVDMGFVSKSASWSAELIKRTSMVPSSAFSRI